MISIPSGFKNPSLSESCLLKIFYKNLSEVSSLIYFSTEFIALQKDSSDISSLKQYDLNEVSISYLKFYLASPFSS